MTYSGIRVEPKHMHDGKHFVAPPIRDISIHLHRLCRYGGAVREWWSVLQHSLAVFYLLRARGESLVTQLAGLLHDAHEAITNDVPSFWKPKELKEWQKQLDELIFNAYLGGYQINANWAAVHKADLDILFAESYKIGPIGIGQWVDLPQPDAMEAFKESYDLTFHDNVKDHYHAKGIMEFVRLFHETQSLIFAGGGVR